MNLDEAITHLRESLADPAHDWGCEECRMEHEQLLEWLVDYRQLKEDYIDLDRQLRDANTALDSFRWIPCSERMPEDKSRVIGFGRLKKSGSWFIDDFYYSREKWLNFSDLEELPERLGITHWMPLPAPPERSETE